MSIPRMAATLICCLLAITSLAGANGVPESSPPRPTDSPVPSRTPPTNSLSRDGAVRDQATDAQDSHADATPIREVRTKPHEVCAQGNSVACNNYCEPCQGQATSADDAGWIDSLSAIIVAAFTGGLLLTSYKQWRAVRDTNVRNTRGFRIQQRPYVMPDEDNPIIFNEGKFPVPAGVRIPIEIRFQNHGNSPALKTRFFLKFHRKEWRGHAPADDMFRDDVDRGDLNNTMIPPHYVRRMPSPDVCMSADDALALNGDPAAQRLWAVGRIEYFDSFNLAQPYITTFSLYWHPGVKRWVMSGPSNHCFDPPDTDQ